MMMVPEYLLAKTFRAAPPRQNAREPLIEITAAITRRPHSGPADEKR